MSVRNISVIKNAHKGKVIFVVASGPTAGAIPAEFFAGQIVIAVNEMWQHVQATYMLCHHHEQLQTAFNAGQCVVTSDVNLGTPFGQKHNLPTDWDHFVYKVKPYVISLTPSIDVQALEQDTTDSLVASACTTSEALQFAAHLGARTIYCVGIDGAALDGATNVPGYNVDHTGQPAETNSQHLRLTHPIVLQTRDVLRRKGFYVLSVSPYLGLDLEGHHVTQPPVLRGRALIDELNTTHYARETVPA
jgi:hypothetical protein